ncbi:MAG: hypothetical protein KIT72_10085 [Polyangiaceae bacterium]|nr:hypothetical protein [Polyangiaceae bacterium]MCW5790759.1 hypothetical protein [Polyangiaceae bacterium]
MIASRRGARGFTLAELMVAVTGGLFISIAVFSLARFGSRFYQQETRVANATLGALVGFERLKSDVARAGFLGSPNIARDPALCGSVTDAAANWPTELAHLAAIRIETDHLKAHPVLDTAVNGNIQPDAITLAGSYDSGDEFPIRMVAEAGSGYDVYLQVLSGPMARLGPENLARVFKAGRGMRIVDSSGKHQYGTIAATSYNGGQPIVSLTQAPRLIVRADSSATQCGFKGFETGGLASVVNFVRYELRDVSSDAAHAALFADSAAEVMADDTRVELVRVELDTAGDEIDGSLELVAELAVDLSFGVTASTVGLGDGHQVLEVAEPNDAQVVAIAGDTQGTSARPQHVRSVRARLSVRSREGDRSANITPSATIAPGLYRLALNPAADAAERRYARVRTVQADIALTNQLGVTW